MRRYFVLFVIFLTQMFALSINDAYKKAVEFEKNSDIKNAMKWYKKVAKMSLKDGNKSLDESLENLNFVEVRSAKETKKAYDKYIVKAEDNETSKTMEQMITGFFDLKPYKINYLLPVTYDNSIHKNREKFETEFQLSFKKDILSNLLGFNEKYAFGYTQTSYWQTFKDSTPFRESNYRPEMFVYGFYKDKDAMLKGYQLGLLHESNGRDNEISRSWNRIYLTTFWQIGNVFVAPRVWYRIPERDKKHPNDDFGDDNPDILHYLGYGDLSLLYPYRGHVFKAKIRNNFKFNSHNKGSLELDWTFPLWNDNLFGYIKAFSGYGSSLEDYNHYSNRIGFGFALSR